MCSCSIQLWGDSAGWVTGRPSSCEKTRPVPPGNRGACRKCPLSPFHTGKLLESFFQKSLSKETFQCERGLKMEAVAVAVCVEFHSQCCSASDCVHCR